MKIHDIIIGDLGRKGTLRYFQAFSAEEQKYLSKNVDSEEFYDEYRMIRYTIVGALRDIKHEILPETLGEIEDSVLVGVEGGPDPIEILPQVVNLVVPYAVNAVKLGADMIRILIPCNTMYSVAVRLRDVFSGPQNLMQFIDTHDLHGYDTDTFAGMMQRVKVSVPAVAEEVVKELDRQGTRIVRVAASKAANSAYERVIRKQYDHMEYEEWLPPGIETFSELLQLAIKDQPIPEDQAPPACALVSACTDIAIPQTLDSTAIFARSLVREAYERLELD